MKHYTILILALLGMSILTTPVLAVSWIRPTTTTTIATIADPYLDQFNAVWGGNSSSFYSVPNVGVLLTTAWSVYTDNLGVIAWVILFAIPFIMIWISGDSVLMVIAAIILSGYILVKIPTEYQIAAFAGIVIVAASLLWSLYKRNF